MALKTTNSRKEEAPLGIAGSEDSKEVLRTLLSFAPAALVSFMVSFSGCASGDGPACSSAWQQFFP